MTRAPLHIGTSGWQYRHWTGPFYPEGTVASKMLDHYVRQFRTVEINSTFYGLPSTDTLQGWRDAVPEGFTFACKASRYITHNKKLKDPADSTRRFLGAVDALGGCIGPLLVQLPPNWRANPERLSEFLKTLPEERRFAFEFRDRSWFTQEVYDLLERHNAALCVYELAGYRSPAETTADFCYVRLHGPGDAYEGEYDGRTLSGWARRFGNWRDAGTEVFCYFDNDEKGYAATDALRLLDMAHG